MLLLNKSILFLALAMTMTSGRNIPSFVNYVDMIYFNPNAYSMLENVPGAANMNVWQIGTYFINVAIAQPDVPFSIDIVDDPLTNAEMAELEAKPGIAVVIKPRKARIFDPQAALG